ncbi:hypothetical protein AAFF_G00192180 [Aldrovandia affinis]|uniref:60S ribosomal protein L27 n=1 Tax=Aldrovandia affinis TaxID=143900 RepID=A0AAD7W638_9TELE|nr:hypothetical protein AAFF_G00192180 [Aldrovandia affinis]
MLCWTQGCNHRKRLTMGHLTALIATLLCQESPAKGTTTMGKKKVAKRPTIKVFVVCNYNHLMPTRYSVDIRLDKTVVNKETKTCSGTRLRSTNQEAKI